MHSLSWQDCVSIAVKNNPDLASSRYAMQSSRDSYYGSFNGLLPQLSLSNNYNDSSSFASSGGMRWQAQGSASLDIFNLSQIADIRSASAAYSQSRADLRRASVDLRVALRRAFAQLLFSQEKVEVSRMIRDMRRRNAQLVALRYDSGRESKGNMMRSQAQALQAQANLDQAMRDLRTAQKSLARHLGLDASTVATATGSLDSATPPELPADFRPFAELRPDIEIQEAAVRNSRADLSQAWSSVWPAVSANYSRGRSGGREFPSDRYSWSLTGVLSYPIFGGGPTATYFAVSSAKKSLEKALQDLRSVRNQAVVDLETSWSSFAEAVDQVKVQTALLQAARQRNDEADIQYGSGLLNFNNWEIIATDRINTERLSIQAQLNAVDAEAQWDHALGKGLE